MQIVIDIDENVFTRLFDNGVDTSSEDRKVIDRAVRNGIVLPKGHGELIDKEVVLDMMNHGILEEYITVMGGVIPADR